MPDLVTTAKGITSAYAPMGAVFVRDHVAESLHQPGVTFRHGITFGGHPAAAARRADEHRDLRARGRA